MIEAVTDLDWDTLPEPVRDFLASVSGGTTVKRAGVTVGRWVPIKPPLADAGEWTDAKNRRRCELIDRMIDGTLTPEEESELGDLRRQLRRHINAVAPLPLAEAERLHQELLELVAKRRAGEPS